MALDTEAEEEKGGSGGKSGCARGKSDNIVTELLTTAVSDTEERQRLMSSEVARPSDSSPLPGSSGAAAAAAGPKVQFAAASTVLDETDDAGNGGRGIDDGQSPDFEVGL